MFDSSFIVNHKSISPNLNTFYVGYDLGQYRNEPFTDILLDTIVDFAFGFHTGILTRYNRRLLVEAARSIYRIKAFSDVKWVYVDNDSELHDCEISAQDKFLKRGEFGEMIQHLLLRDFFKTLPLLAKIHFKDTDNTAVHGFDVVHIGPDPKTGEESIYFGESKIFSRKDGKGGLHGISELINDIKHHFKSDFLYREIALIVKKKDAFKTIDEYDDKNTIEQYKEFLEKKKYWYDKLQALEAKKIKLQDFFKSVTIPLICTYQSKIFDGCTDETCNAFTDELMAETETLNRHFQTKLSEIETETGDVIRTDLNIILMLFPIPSKKQLVRSLHEKLYHQQK